MKSTPTHPAPTLPNSSRSTTAARGTPPWTGFPWSSTTSNDLSYGSVDLDGLTTDSDGYAVVCGDVGAAFAVNCDLDSPVSIQNGQDALALYAADGTSFPVNTSITLDG